jgi:hypothetical protein
MADKCPNCGHVEGSIWELIAIGMIVAILCPVSLFIIVPLGICAFFYIVVPVVIYKVIKSLLKK